MQARTPIEITHDEAPLAADDFFWRERCQHRWLVDGPAGPTSHAVCSRCGEEKDFFNNPEAVLRQPAGPPSR